MRLKFLFFASLFTILHQAVYAQATTNWLETNSNLIKVTYTHMNQQGERYEISNDEKVVINGSSFSYLRLYAKGLGGGVRLSRTVFKPSETQKRVMWSFGPKGVYFFNDGSNVSPYLGTSVGYSQQKRKDDDYVVTWKGYYVECLGGLALSKDSLIVLFEGGFNYAKGSEDKGAENFVTGSLFYLSIGMGISF